MPDDSLFSRSNKESHGDDPTEGVRLVSPDEAEKAVERGEAVKRRESDQPKFGDRPPPPPVDVKPALRFPLADSADPAAVERPRVAPVEPRRAPGDTGSQEQPVISVEPATGETELPHWTEPATGEVPRVVIGDLDAESDPEEVERWADFAASGGPRWRDQDDAWDDSDVSDLGGREVDDEPLGALDTSVRQTQEEFFNFDDLDVPEAESPRARGSAADPIQIQSSRPQPAAPVDPIPVVAPRRGPTRGSGGGRRGPRERPERATRPEAPSYAEEPVAQEPPAQRGRSVPDDAEPAPVSDEDGGSRDVPMAAFVGVAIAVVAVILFKVGPAAAMILVVAVLALSAVEYFSVLQRSGYRPATLLGLAATLALPLALYWRGESAIALVLFLTVVFTLLWYLLGVSGSARVLPNVGVTLFGVMWIGFLGSFAALILHIPVQGVSILLVTVISAVFSDVGAFFSGRQFGRTPLASVSPSKTVEGMVGGFVAAVVGVLVFAVVFGFGPFSAGQALVFGLATAVAAPFGDLCESLVKRDLGLKDMGSLLPEHGGILDRFDGMLFVLPVAYYTARAFSLAA